MQSLKVDKNGRLILDPAGWALVRQINQKGNKIVWTPDQKTWGVEERWDFPVTKSGKQFEDCDGITLWKMDALLKEGVPSSCLLFCVVKTETGEGHAVLCVTTNRGDYICDNRFSDVKSYDDLKAHGYRFMYRSAVGGSLQDVWNKIQER